MLNRRFKGRRAARLFAAVSAAFLFSTVSEAQTITYVSAVGNDANPCNVITAPCRTLQRGINTVLAGGEVRLLTSLQGNAVITKSLSIAGDGATLVGTIVVNSASAVVTLRGLALDGFNGFANGVDIDAAAVVQIQDCTIERYVSNGILLEATATAELFVTGSAVRNNGVNGLKTNGTTSKLTVETSQVENNGEDGIDVSAIESTISRVVSSANGGDGIEQNLGRMNVTDTTAANNAVAGFRTSGELTLKSVVGRGNSFGLFVSTTGATARISESVFTNNGTGLEVTVGGTLLTLGNNVVDGNTAETSGTITPLAPL